MIKSPRSQHHFLAWNHKERGWHESKGSKSTLNSICTKYYVPFGGVRLFHWYCASASSRSSTQGRRPSCAQPTPRQKIVRADDNNDRQFVSRFRLIAVPLWTLIQTLCNRMEWVQRWTRCGRGRAWWRPWCFDCYSARAIILSSRFKGYVFENHFGVG
jgi:hypothetical protein